MSQSADNLDNPSSPESKVAPESKVPEKSGLSFSLSDLWQQIPRPHSNPEHETSVIVDTPPKVILGESFNDEQAYIKRVESLIWLTYRTGFEPIPKNETGPSPLQFIHSMVFNKNPLSTNIHSFVDNENFTTDVGWGCMIRTSQSLLANAYLRVIKEEQKVLGFFKDTSAAPFSLHNFIRVANESPLQVKPGQWFGPNAASLSIQRLCNGKGETGTDGPGSDISVLISETSDLYDDKVKEAFKKCPNVLVLLPIRLGVDKTNNFYFSSILHLLSCKQSVGIAGGRPSSSFYFFGYDNDDLLYLDPHFPQTVNQQSQSYHTSRYQRLNINELDPSMMIGILLYDFEDYQSFKTSCVGSDNKIIHFADAASEEEDIDFDFDEGEDEMPEELEDPEEIEDPKVEEFDRLNHSPEEEEEVLVENKDDTIIVNNENTENDKPSPSPSTSIDLVSEPYDIVHKV